MHGFGGHSGAHLPRPKVTGLPFAGVPHELQERVDEVLATEPDHVVAPVVFSHADWDRRPFTLWRFVGEKRAALAVAFVLVVVETLMITIGPFLTGKAIDQGIIAGDRGALMAIAAIYVASVVAGTGFSMARIAWTGRVGEALTERLRVRIFAHFQRLSLRFFTDEKGGVLMTRMTSDVDSLTALFQEGLVNMFVQAFTLTIVTVVVFVVSPTLALVLFVGVVPVMVVLTWWFRSASDVAFLAVRDRIADVMSDLQENLGGIRVVSATNRARRNIVSHDNVLGRYRDANDRTADIGAVYGPSTEMLGYLAQAMLLGFGGVLVARDSLSVGELATFFLYLTMFFAPIQQLVQLYNTYQQGRAAVRKLGELFATEPDVVETPGAPDLPTMDGAIDFDHVTFGYDPAVPVLHDVTLRITAGETIAFVGETGAGKSTVAKLVNRYYDPTAGAVRIDGHDLRDVTLASVRSQIGVVPQEPFLFAGSIRDNLTFAAPGATDDDLWAAVDAVGLRHLVERDAAGLDQIIHERGSSLSSGERQLVALARAFLSQPRILVLDEATSNLDLARETQVEIALDAVVEGRTAIIIAHRLATAMRADRIAVVHDGEIVELGSHDELVARGGRYGALHATWEAQTGASGRSGGSRTASTPAVAVSEEPAAALGRSAPGRGGPGSHSGR